MLWPGATHRGWYAPGSLPCRAHRLLLADLLGVSGVPVLPSQSVEVVDHPARAIFRPDGGAERAGPLSIA